jgi:hypothetical protein
MPSLVKMMDHIYPIEISKIKTSDYFFSFTIVFIFRLYVAHSLAIAFCVFELIPLILGITSINFGRSFFGMSNKCHRNDKNIYFLL